ncbi:peptide deformylase [Gilvibacter sediminis]|uniref:peptide deformylase n=1 Tax=Gilvibacter sediminis TaxID=379071 RepID=UPI002350DBAA|nr:peptide deformylase [Gilvibacter sediminis]MDC7998876.1 peptide deformylase [Gilvibacter sediminis]
MILPIVAFGDPVLRKKAVDIKEDHPDLDVLLENMFETMYGAHGIGLAAPQVGRSIRLFLVDATPFEDDEDLPEEERKMLSTFKKVFINAQILKEEGDEWAFNEGCLSIPDIREDVFRQETITIKYLDENFKEHTDTYSGIAARIIQHEYDHIEGILFTDKLSPLKKRLIKGKLNNISKGKVNIDYKMRFPNPKKKR